VPSVSSARRFKLTEIASRRVTVDKPVKSQYIVYWHTTSKRPERTSHGLLNKMLKSFVPWRQQWRDAQANVAATNSTAQNARRSRSRLQVRDSQPKQQRSCLPRHPSPVLGSHYSRHSARLRLLGYLTVRVRLNPSTTTE
jgi:hypothetical protein